jgi:hypothetical protein
MITDWDDDWDDYWDGQLIMHTGWKPNLRFVRLLLGWDEVGWGGLITLIYTCAHASRYPTVGSLALAHMRRATLFSCTCTHASRYAAAGSLALAHMRRATLGSCTCTHASCYAAAGSLALAQKRIIRIEWLDLEICSHMAMVLGSKCCWICRLK